MTKLDFRLWRKPVYLLISIIFIFSLTQLIPGCSFFKALKEEEKILEGFQFGSNSFQHVAPGEYFGECSLPLKSARVRVVVVNQGRLSSIELLRHTHGPGKSGEGVIDSVLQKQSLDVDAITGATKSSLVVLKAIENAFSGKSCKGGNDGSSQ